MKNKILLFDIETSPTLGYVWQLWEANVLKVVKPWNILCFSYKWLGGKTQVVSLPHFGANKKRPSNSLAKNEIFLVRKLWELFNEADVIVAHNGDKFDIKKSYAKFIEYGLNPPAPFKTVDTLKVARRYFKFDSNKLDSLGDFLHLGRKVHTGGFDLWDRCMQGNLKAFKLMERYNKGDVDLLEKVYFKLRPYIQNHPNFNVFDGTNHSCPNCGSSKIQRRGYSYSRTTKYQRWQCQKCFSWHQSTLNPNSIIK
jgi:hypothetical protein